jgi:SpoIID/LytB domain protein
MSAATSTRRAIAALAAVVLMTGLVLGVGARTPARAAADDVVLTGHGFGHGRGLSQWGAFGYATRFGWNHLQILGRYYSNAGMSDIGNPLIAVRLMARDGADLAVTSAAPFTVNGQQYPGGTAAQLSRNADGTWQLTTRTGCSGAVTGTVQVTGTTVNTIANPGDDLTRMLTLCGPESRTYRGALTLVWDGSALRTTNTLFMEDYLRGVVPRESPASWGDAANGAGLNALMAQAVAARSYARSEARYPYASTCDTTTCQVYGGAGLNGASLEDARTDRAVVNTSGDVMTLGGLVARTEFHSSSGGWTAGGTFPAVQDDGDVASPFHDWSVAVPRATISAAFGVGTVQAVTVLSRNGLGADGGRVVTVRVTGSGGSVDVTGTDFRTALALRSDWFVVVPALDPTRDDISPIGVAAVRTSAGTVLAFVRGTDGALWVTTATNGVFSAYRRIPAGTRSGPAAVSTDGSRVDLFVAGTDRALWHTVTTVDAAGQPTTFSAWESLGGALTAAPAAASSASGRLIVSVRGTDGAVWSRTFDGSWSPWQSAGGAAVSAPAIDVADANTYRVLVIGTDGTAWAREVSAAGGAAVSGWSFLGQYSATAPGASGNAWWARSIRAVAYSSGSGVRQIWGGGQVVNIGGAVTSGLALVELGTTSTWTFARGTDAALWLNIVTGSGASSAWFRVGGAMA